MKRFLLALGALCAVMTSATGADGDIYVHKGALVEIKVEGATVTIKYPPPSGNSQPAWVHPGAIVFEGGINKKSDEIGGTAYLFWPKCGSFPYTVSGHFGPGNWVLKLRGPAPIVDANCHVVRYTSQGANAELEFHKPE
jgi:hypothetical protein